MIKGEEGVEATSGSGTKLATCFCSSAFSVLSVVATFPHMPYSLAGYFSLPQLGEEIVVYLEKQLDNLIEVKNNYHFILILFNDGSRESLPVSIKSSTAFRQY